MLFLFQSIHRSSWSSISTNTNENMLVDCAWWTKNRLLLLYRGGCIACIRPRIDELYDATESIEIDDDSGISVGGNDIEFFERLESSVSCMLFLIQSILQFFVQRTLYYFCQTGRHNEQWYSMCIYLPSQFFGFQLSTFGRCCTVRKILLVSVCSVLLVFGYALVLNSILFCGYSISHMVNPFEPFGRYLTGIVIKKDIVAVNDPSVSAE